MFVVLFTRQASCQVISFTFVKSAVCHSIKLQRFAKIRTIERHFKTTTCYCSIGFCCFQRCVDRILHSVGGQCNLSFCRNSFSLKYLFFQELSRAVCLFQKNHFNAIAFRVIEFDLMYLISQSFCR